MLVDKPRFVLETKVGFKLVERKEGRWKGKKKEVGKRAGKRKKKGR